MNWLTKKARIPSLPASSIRSQLIKLALVALAYFIAVRLGLLFVAQPEGIASLWPASGLALAVLLLNPKRQWPQFLAVIFVVNAAGNLNSGNPFLVSLGFALANILEAFLAAWVLLYFCKPKITFRRMSEVLFLFVVAILSNALTALFGAAVSALAFGAPFLNTWLVWWTSDGLGMLLITPLIVTWVTSQSMFQTASPRRIAEGLFLVILLAVFAWLLFGKFTLAEEPVLRNYMLFPFLIWLAFRFSPRGMASAITLLSAIAIWNTLHGFGIFGFADQSVTQKLVSVQMLLSVLVFTGLLLSALITERKHGEAALRVSEDKFKYVFDHSVVGKSLTLPSGELNVNQALCDMLGYSSEELKHRKWQEITHPDDVELTQAAINALISGEKESVRFNKRYLHKDGSIVWTDLGTTLRRDSAGKPLYFITSVLDISERKRAEEALSETSERLKHMISNSPTIIYDLRVEGDQTIPIWISDNIQSILGFSAQAALQPEWWLEQIHPQDLPAVQASLGHLFDDFYQHEYRFLCQDGRQIWLHDEHRLLRDSENKPAEIIGAWIDITDRKLAEQELKSYSGHLEELVTARTRELQAAQEKLIRQEKLAVLGELAGSVGHELRNPLAVISNAVYYLKLVQPDVNEKIRHYHDMIENEARIAEKIITDLLDFARIKSLERETVSVPELIQRVLARFPVPESVTLVLDLPADLPPVFADQRQMEQVLGNLVVNAGQAMPQGGKLNISACHSSETGKQAGIAGNPQLTDDRSPTTDDNSPTTDHQSLITDSWVQIAVQDNGIGIPPENISKLFEPLFTTKPKGIGLGLAVSRKLAEANGGRIQVQSEVGKGSTFTLYLPVYLK